LADGDIRVTLQTLHQVADYIKLQVYSKEIMLFELQG